MMSIQFTDINNDTSVVIQDLIVSSQPGFMQYGEFCIGPADENTQLGRLLQEVKSLMDLVSTTHKSNCNEDGSIREDKLNNITRLVTQENYFYTKKPLSMSEFSLLHNLILEYEKLYPENMHLVLSSFAVKTTKTNDKKDKKIMNVAASLNVEKTLKFTSQLKITPGTQIQFISKLLRKGLKFF